MVDIRKKSELTIIIKNEMAKVECMPILIKEREILRYFNMGHNNIM